MISVLQNLTYTALKLLAATMHSNASSGVNVIVRAVGSFASILDINALKITQTKLRNCGTAVKNF